MTSFQTQIPSLEKRANERFDTVNQKFDTVRKRMKL